MHESITLPELMKKIKALREAGLRAEHVALSFMKRRVQPQMARDTLGYQYTGDEDTPRMPGDEVDNDDIIKRLGKIFESSILVLPRRPRNVTRKRASKKLKIIETTSQEVGTVNCVVEYF
jgi:hypothetical protein